MHADQASACVRVQFWEEATVDPIAMLEVMSQIPRHAVLNPALEPIANEARERSLPVAKKLGR